MSVQAAEQELLASTNTPREKCRDLTIDHHGVIVRYQTTATNDEIVARFSENPAGKAGRA